MLAVANHKECDAVAVLSLADDRHAAAAVEDVRGRRSGPFSHQVCGTRGSRRGSSDGALSWWSGGRGLRRVLETVSARPRKAPQS
jgi:hypothetical protein